MATGARAAPIPGMAATQRSGRAAMRRSSWRLGVVSLLATAPLAGAATLYVAPLASFEPTAAGLRYVPGPNQAVPVTLGTNAFTDFGDAVTVANTNADTRNTIRVAEGGFDVAAPQVRVSKDLTVIGAGSGATIVRATTNTPAQTGDGRAFLLIDRGVSVHLSQLAIEGQAPGSIAAAPPVRVPDGIRFTETGTALPAASLLDDLAFQSIRGGNPSANDFDGVALNVLAGDVTVARWVFVNIGRVGASYSDAVAAGPATAPASRLGKTYIGKGAGDTLDFGVQITGGTSVTVAGNTSRDALGEASSDGSDSAGVLVFQDTSSGEAPPSATIRYNTFYTNRQGITVGVRSEDASSVTITENNIVHNAGAFGIFSPRTATFPATDNFWGSPVGPFNVVNNPTGDPTNQVSSPVTPLTPFASVPFPLDFPPSPSAIPFAFPPASIATVAGTIGGTVRRAGTGTPQSGVAVILDDNGNGSLDQGEVETATDGQGNYGFTNLVGADGGTAYEVVPVLPPSSTAVPARQIAILSGGEIGRASCRGRSENR